MLNKKSIKIINNDKQNNENLNNENDNEEQNKLIKNLPSKINIKLIDEFEIDGDFIESQAFAFLAIRRCIKLPITFPNTTNCSKPSIGGEIIDY